MELLNKRHEMFARAVIKNGGNLSGAYMEIYKSKPDTARHGGSFLLRNVEIRRRISELMEAQGLGITELNKKLKDMLNAKKGSSYQEGGVVKYRDDVRTQMEALGLAYKIHGLIGHSNPDSIEIFLSPEKLESIAKEQEDKKDLTN